MAQPVLVVIDYQQAFEDEAFWGARNNPQAEANAAAVLTTFRERRLPVIHIQHDSATPGSPLAPGKPGHALKELTRPRADEPLLHKSVNSGFIGTDLEHRLRALQADPVVIFGATTDHCVSTTTRMSANLGFRTILVGDACFTFDRKGIAAGTVHRVELAVLDGEFASVVTAAGLIADFDGLCGQGRKT
jgi:nicotinamidase-related amidase